MLRQDRTRIILFTSVCLCFSFIACQGEQDAPQPQRGSSVGACPSADQRDAVRFRPEAPDPWLKVYEPLLDSLFKEEGAHPVWCGSRTDEVYRVVLLPANRPVVIATVRIDDAARQSTATVFVDPRTSEVARTNRFRLVASRTDQAVDDHTWRTLKQSRDAANFWTTPAWRSQPDTMDGYVWIIEGRRAGNYRMVIRDNFRDRPFERFALQILKIAGVPTNPDTVGDYVEP